MNAAPGNAAPVNAAPIDTPSVNAAPLGWLGIVRLGLVQTALGAVVVLTTSTFNRIMVVEYALPALVPGMLVALHYAIQVLRPRMGYGSDLGGRCTPWIRGGMAVLAAGGVSAAFATGLVGTHPAAGIALALASFVAIGLGVGAAGTSLLVLLAKRTAPARRPAAASLVWIMMIAGFVITTATAGRFLDPYTPARLVTVAAVVAAAALALALLAVWGVEGRAPAAVAATPAARPPFRHALAEVWAEAEARQFAIFVFVAMLAYSAEELILEPFAGAVFALTPGASTRLAGVQHGGALCGMILLGIAATLPALRRRVPLRAWTLFGCAGSAAGLLALAASPSFGAGWPLRPSYFALGLANGVFAASAVASMMSLAGKGRTGREGLRMGVWGAAQAVAFGAGGLAGTGAVDLARTALGTPSAYAIVFAAEALLFVAAGILAARLGRAPRAILASQPIGALAISASPISASKGVRRERYV